MKTLSCPNVNVPAYRGAGAALNGIFWRVLLRAVTGCAA